jgi:hypothetical protein
MPYTIGAIPDKEETVWCLSGVYKYLKGVQREMKVQKGIDLASRLSWKRTGEEFERVVRKVLPVPTLAPRSIESTAETWGCSCLVEGKITDDNQPYKMSIAPYKFVGFLADRNCPLCHGTGEYVSGGLD